MISEVEIKELVKEMKVNYEFARMAFNRAEGNPQVAREIITRLKHGMS